MITDYIDEKFLLSLEVDENTSYELESVQALKLLSINRIDIIAKYMLMLFKIKGIKSELAYETYKNHIEIFSEGRFYEPGSKSKTTFERFLSEFDDIYENLKNNGFDSSISYIPIGKDGGLLNGAHRTAAAMLLGINVDVVRLLEISGACYDYRYFERKNIKREYLDFMALNYMKLAHQNVYAVCVWPRAVKKNKEKELEQQLRDNVKIIYKRRVKLNRNGLKMMTIHLYSDQEWLGTASDNYCGVYGKLYECYDNDDTVFYFIEGKDLEDILSLKEKLREIYNMGKHSLHITDTREEAITVSELVLNKNSINAMNYGNPIKLNEEISKLKSLVYGKEDEMILNPKYTLEIYGGNTSITEPLIPINSLSKDVIYDIRNYFYYMGLHFIAPEYAMELSEHEIKERFKNIIEAQRIPTSVWFKEKINRSIYLIKRNTKAFLRKVGALDLIYKILRKIRNNK